MYTFWFGKNKYITYIVIIHVITRLDEGHTDMIHGDPRLSEMHKLMHKLFF